MSEVLARIRVQESHGIRRFLYPLTAEVTLPRTLDYTALGFATRDNDVDMNRLCLVGSNGRPIPSQLTHTVGEQFRLDFAVSLAPGASEEYLLIPGPAQIVNDPLHIQPQEPGVLLHSLQERFEIALNEEALIDRVIYDSVSHLREAMTITRTNVMRSDEEYLTLYAKSPSCVTLNAWTAVSLPYKGNESCKTYVELTACKSWATVTHRIEKTQPGEEITFTLPFAVASPILTYDLGLEGIYGKIDRAKSETVTWRMTRGEGDGLAWSVANSGRTDYAGRMTEAEFAWKRWLHLIDGSKALAVAITDVPSTCREVEARLESDGTVIIAFRMGTPESAYASFGVCYHFLNDIPAIAAATNPQSILLPPTVEVLQ